MSDYFSLAPKYGNGGSTGTTPGTLSRDDISLSLSEHAKRKPMASPGWVTLSQESPTFVSVPIPLQVSAATSATAAEDAEGYEAQFVREYPTDLLADRFRKWRKILKGIVTYLREVAYAQEQYARINNNLRNAVKFPFLTDLEEGTNLIFDPLSSQGPKKKPQPSTMAKKQPHQQEQHQEQLDVQAVQTSDTDTTSAASGFMKFGSGSIQDIQVILKKYHLSLSSQQFKISKELVTVVIPKLEDLRKDLQSKIKEIKDLHGDFKTNLKDEVLKTQQLLHKYTIAVKLNNNPATPPEKLKSKNDPFLLKLQLDIQLKKQVSEENYLKEAFVNLQSSGMKLEKIVYSKIQNTLQRYCALMDSEARLMLKNLCQEMHAGITSKPPAMEWDHFVSHHPTSLLNWKSYDPIPVPRKLTLVTFPEMKSPQAKCIRAGYLSKKSKFDDTYRTGYFVLTANYLHEFKDSNFFKSTAAHYTAGAGATPAKNATYPSSITSGSGSAASIPGSSVPPEKKEKPSHSSHASKAPYNNNNVNNMVPLMSISLNDCALIESSKSKFILVGTATFNEVAVPKKSAVSGAKQSKSLQTDGKAPKKSMPNDAEKPQNKSRLHKLIKGGKSKVSSAASTSLSVAAAATKRESVVAAPPTPTKHETVHWTFKHVAENPTDEEMKHFRKWVLDMKNLSQFHTTKERIKYIEDRILKAQSNKVRNKSMVSSETTLIANSEGSRSVDVFRDRQNRPQFIQLPSSQTNSMLEVGAMHGSRVNTPAIDEKGNLITIAEVKPILASNTNAALLTPGASISQLSASSTSPAASINNAMIQQQRTPGIAITSNGIMTPIEKQMLVDGRQHQRTVSLTASFGGTSMPLSTPHSVHSEGAAANGNVVTDYFTIPIADTTNNSSQLSTPSNPEDRSRTYSRSSSQSRDAGRKSSSGSYFDNTDQGGYGTPALKLNDHDEALPARNGYIMKQDNSASTPLLSAEQTHFYSQGNNSSSGLITPGVPSANATTARVQLIRKHRKNVSFSSMNSLVFSKKATKSSGNLMSGEIREHDDDGKHDNDGKIRLNQSIYS